LTDMPNSYFAQLFTSFHPTGAAGPLSGHSKRLGAA
jgi:hypothetical protein